MAIIRPNGILLVTAKPTHTPTSRQATLARLFNTMTFYHYNGTTWETTDMESVVKTVTGTAVDNTDPANPVIDRQTAAEVAVVDALGNYTANNVEDILAEIKTYLSGITDTAITAINLIATANPNEYSVVISWTDGDGNSQTTTDPTPVTISGLTDLSYTSSPTKGTVVSSNGSNTDIPLATGTNAGLQSPADKTKVSYITVTEAIDLDSLKALILTAVQTVSDTNSINLLKTGTSLSAALKISATQGPGVTVDAVADGLRVVVNQADTKPPEYISLDAATAALGVNKKFMYAEANLDGANAFSIAWT